MTSAKKWRLVCATLVCTAATVPRGPAAALDHIDYESWSFHSPGNPPPGTLPPGEQVASVALTFDAKLTNLDRKRGVQFAVALDDSRGPQTLLEWHYLGIKDLPPAGSTVHVDVGLAITCNQWKDVVSSWADETWLRWNSNGQERREKLPSYFNGRSAEVSGPFRLTVVDQNKAYGPHSTLPQACPPRPHVSIGISFDPEGTVCQGTIRPGIPSTIYVIAKLEHLFGDGATGAEFRFTGIPDAWKIFPVANPEALTLGDPFATGVAMGFACQSPPSGVVTLYQVEVLASDEVPDLEFGIAGRAPPLNPDFACPFVLGCDAFFTKYCVDVHPCFVNTTVPKPCGRAVAVTDRTWSQVKAMYR